LEVHDREWIERNPGVPFFHFTRECGTFLIGLIPAEDYPKVGETVPYLFGYADRYHILNEVLSMLEAIKGMYKNRLALHFDGLTFREIDFNRAYTIAMDYTVKIRRQWTREQRRPA